MKTSKVSIELIAPSCDAKVLYCSGTFNEWNTSSRVVSLQQVAPGLYRGEADWGNKPLRYKYHLGNWDFEELNEWGLRRGERHYEGEGDIHDYVPQFLDKGNYHNPAYLPIIEPLPSNLPLPKPFATRRIAALLPYNYERSGNYYPVIYLQDGQNLFDEFAPYGNWELDKRLAWLAERGMGEFIVVAIDHARDKRVKEYAPPHRTRIGKGDADKYGDFVVNHLKRLIDRTYRTLPGRRDTAIGGSSMGALASTFVAMSYPEVFGAAMLLSPSIWVDPKIISSWPAHTHGDTHLFVYGGMRESPQSAASFTEMCALIRARSTMRRRLLLHHYFEPEGQHNEAAWGAVFPRAVSQLFHH